jgi:iron complex transport system ATP-binding protein
VSASARPVPARPDRQGEAGALGAARLWATDLWLDGEGGRSRLAGATLTLESGRLAAVVGPNGAGKSSLLACLAGLARPRFGAVGLDNVSLFSLSRAHLAQSVALVAPWTLPDVDLRVREVVSLGRLRHRTSVWQDPARVGAGTVESALAATALLELGDRPLSTLSAGERQRARLATALAQGARFLLLDEPTASLDPGHARHALEIARALAREGHGLAIVLHDLTAAGQYADVLHLMAGGRVVAAGAPEEVLRREVLEPVYKTPLEVIPHPQTGRPVVVGGLGPTLR